MSKDRKSDHIKIALEEDIEVGSSGFEYISFVHEALPEIDLHKVDLSCSFLKKKLRAPFLIEAMTGGTEEAMTINAALAGVAGELGLGFEVGSQRPALEDHSLEETYSVIKAPAKKTLVIGNLGAVQLNYNYGVKEARAAVDMINADALALHLNPLQEAIQPEGDTNFSNLSPKIKEVCESVGVPVIAKEVGCGISEKTAKKLLEAGVYGIDIGGYGGTSWDRIEGFRAEGEMAELSEMFEEWGIPTAFSLLELKDINCPKIASGGIRNGIDAAKAIALGADLVGVALPLLRALDSDGEEGATAYLRQMADELKLAMFLTGSKKLSDLKHADVRIMGKASEWIETKKS